jgi:general secretion pathway protein G
MIVVAIIGILSAIAIPKFADLIRKSNEGSTKGNLGAIRSALNIYYSDMEGYFPTDTSSMTIGGKYLRSIPQSKVPPYHAAANVVQPDVNFDTGGGWNYVPFPTDEDFGKIIVNCTHTDSKGSDWNLY